MNSITVQWQAFEGNPGVMNPITYARRRYARALCAALEQITREIAGSDCEVNVVQYVGTWPIAATVSVPPAGLAEEQIDEFNLAMAAWNELAEIEVIRRAAQVNLEDVLIGHCAPVPASA